jgi:transcription elongation factor GreB
VGQAPSNEQQVFFSATVTLEDEKGDEIRYRIVGPDETGHAAHYISMDSPVAKALFKKTLDVEINVQTPAGKRNYVICAIDYAAV